MLNKIVQDRYYGTDKIKGICIKADPTGKHDWYVQFLLESGPFSVGGFISRGGSPVIEQDRVRGRIAFENQGGPAFSIAFEAPLRQWSASTTAHESSADEQKVLSKFNTLMSGWWSIERWTSAGGHSNTGNLFVDQRIDERTFHGVLHFKGGLGGKDVDEDVVITSEGTTIRIDGQSATDTTWSLDHLIFDLVGDRLLGGGKDEKDTVQRVELRKERRRPDTN